VIGVSLDEKSFFDSQYLGHQNEALEESKHRRFVAVLVHLISLLHALALGTLSGDLSAHNIEVRIHCPDVKCTKGLCKSKVCIRRTRILSKLYKVTIKNISLHLATIAMAEHTPSPQS
jgi:hypothetical protein